MKQKKIIFKDCVKGFTKDQDKAVTPDKTLEHFFKRIEGLEINILSEVKRIDNGRLDIPVYFSVCTDEAQAMTGTKKQMGKGASEVQSKASACMELAERFSFFAFQSNENNFIRGDFQMMRALGYPVIGTQQLLKSVGDETMTEEQLESLLEGIPIRWTWATDISDNNLVMIPFSWFYAINEFNGSSAGNTTEEAALQGISEVVERDVCSRINREKIQTPLIDQSSIKDPVAVELLDKFNRNNIELYLSDFSLDTGITTVGALAIDRSTFPEFSEIVFTAGTTPGPEKAVIRAVTEVAQLAGDFNSGSNYVASGLPKPATMNEVEYVTNSISKIAIDEMTDISDDNIKIEIDRCVSALDALDLKIFMIDVTHPDFEIPAHYTIIPGTSFRERSKRKDAGLFAAKMLYEHVEDLDFFEEKIEQMSKILEYSYYLSFYRGISHFNRGDFQVGLKYFDEALDQNPEKEDLPYIYSYKGHCLKDLGKYDLAIEVLEKGRKEDEERSDIHNLLGFCFFKKEDYQKAIHHFERAVHINPSSAMDYANLGVNHNRLGNKEEAVRYFTLALTMDPSLEFVQEQLNQLMNK